MNPHKRQLALLLTVALITYSGYGFACGSSSAIKSFRLALASSGPLVNSLVAAGVIDSTRASLLITDFNDAAGCGLALQNAFAAIDPNLPDRERTSLKLNASVNALRCFRTIVQRQNFAVNARIQTVANIAEGILASLVVFYSEPGEMRASAEKSATVTARSEKELEAQLKRQVEELKKAMKP